MHRRLLDSPRRLLTGALAATLALAGGPAGAEPPAVAPHLSAASNFGQWWQPDVFAAARALPLRLFRDEIHWRAVEQEGERLVFDREMHVRYPDLIAGRGGQMIFIPGARHPRWDGGQSVSSPEAIAAFARFTAATVERFPAIAAVEVGNEVNSEDFISGPAWEVPLDERALRYTAVLAAIAREVRAQRPEVRIIGGAAHSLPLYWFAALARAGAPAHMDAAAIHTYAIPPEELRRQVALLRALPGYADMPLEVTEFGTTDAKDAPAYLLRSYCQMALSGVTVAVWYPLAARGDGLAPLLARKGGLTGAGRAWAMLAREIEGRSVRDVAPDPFTYACDFEGKLVIWGESRAVELAPGVVALDPEGRELPAEGLALSMERPLMILPRGAGVRLGETVRLGPQRITADSYHQFVFPGSGARSPFERLVRRGGRAMPMVTRPGQERRGVPWMPYLGTDIDDMARAAPGWVLLGGTRERPVEVIYRHEVEKDARRDITVRIALSPDSQDGAVFGLERDGATLDSRPIAPGAQAVIRYRDLAMRAGEKLDFVLAPGGDAAGDFARFRVTIERAAAP